MKKFEMLGRSLSKGEMKKIMGGNDEVLTPSGDTTACEQGGGTCKTCTVDWCKGLKYCSNGMGMC